MGVGRAVELSRETDRDRWRDAQGQQGRQRQVEGLVAEAAPLAPVTTGLLVSTALPSFSSACTAYWPG